jgi:hypothetical protein
VTAIYDLPFPDYLKSDGITFHKLLAYEHSPLLFKRLFVTREAKRDEETDAMRIGRASHCLTLEGETAFEHHYIVRPETYIAETGKDKGEAKPWHATATVCKAWEADKEAKDLTVISPKEYALMVELRAAVQRHPDGARILAAGWPEVTVRQEHPTLALTIQGRFDWLTPDLEVPDYKTTADLGQLMRELDGLRLFARDERAKRSTAYKYVRQLAWYRHLVQAEWAKGDRARFYLIAAEKAEPYRAGVFEIGKALLDLGEADNAATLVRIAESTRTGVWPGGPEGVVAVEYAGKDIEEASV